MAFQELRNACRSLLRVPALTGLSLATIALGVGAGTALFSVVKAVLLNPLPYPQPERLIWISEVNSSDRPMNVSMANYLDWARQNRTFSAMGGFASMPVNLAGDTPERIVASLVTPGFLEAMGAQPVLGRGFTSSDNVEGAPLSALIGYSLWQRVYNGDPGVLGRTIHLSGYSATIAGVLPRGFSYPERAELWISAVALGDYGTRTAHNYRVVGRLKPGVTLEQAQTDLSEIARRLKREYPGPYMAKDARLTPLLIHTAGKVRPALLILFGAVGLLLLIVCVNVANLLLVRVTSRSRELAVRLAIGAGRFHLVRQMLTESLVLACAGGILGFLLAFWSMDLLRVLLPPDIPRSGEIRVDGLVLAFSFAVSTAAGLLFGLLPAWRATRMNVHDAVKANSRTMTANRRTRLLQSALVVSEVCLSLALLAGAGLLAQSFARLSAVEPGFQSDHVLTADVFFSFPRSEADRQRLKAGAAELLARVRALPGIESAATASALPPNGVADGMFHIQGNPNPPRNTDAEYDIVSSNYLKTLRIPLVAGREFTDADNASAPGVAVVNAEMARLFWPDRSPIGERIWFNSFEYKTEHWLTIVGIAADVHLDGLAQPVAPVAYVSSLQSPRVSNFSLVLRTHSDPSSAFTEIRRILHHVSPEATASFSTMDREMAKSLAQQRFQMQVLGGFAVLALLLAAVGLYGVLSYMVTGSRAEIGIRMALGAPRALIFRMFALRALGLAVAGAALGLAGFFALRKTLNALLFGIGPGDPVTLAAATALLLAVALAAAYFPARRATKVDPMSALREE